MKSRASIAGGGLVLAVAAASGLCFLLHWQRRRRREDDTSFAIQRKTTALTAHEQLIEAGTPLILLKQVSHLLQRSVYVKMESMNPGGTGKDRAALSMIRRAEQQGLLPPPSTSSSPLNDLALTRIDDITTSSVANKTTRADNPKQDTTTHELESMILQAMTKSRTGGLVVEGTSGSTGIALATLCAARGHGCLVVLPDDQAHEKKVILESLGAQVYQVPTASISNPQHYVNLARKATQIAHDEFQIAAVFTDQFENEANFAIHYQQTGPEIMRQMRQQGRRWSKFWKTQSTLDAFVMSSGTGGTIAGVGTYLKEQTNSNSEQPIKVVLVDPPGSSLFHKIEHGVAYAVEQKERTIRKHRYDTLAEGIGLDRITHNFAKGIPWIDQAIRVTDQEAVDMAHWILRMEGLWMGSSSAMNVVGAIRTALELPKDSSVLTIVCDGGQRHATRFWNPEFIASWGLTWPSETNIPACLQKLLVETTTAFTEEEPVIGT